MVRDLSHRVDIRGNNPQEPHLGTGFLAIRDNNLHQGTGFLAIRNNNPQGPPQEIGHLKDPQANGSHLEVGLDLMNVINTGPVEEHLLKGDRVGLLTNTLHLLMETEVVLLLKHHLLLVASLDKEDDSKVVLLSNINQGQQDRLLHVPPHGDHHPAVHLLELHLEDLVHRVQAPGDMHSPIS